MVFWFHAMFLLTFLGDNSMLLYFKAYFLLFTFHALNYSQLPCLIYYCDAFFYLFLFYTDIYIIFSISLVFYFAVTRSSLYLGYLFSGYPFTHLGLSFVFLISLTLIDSLFLVQCHFPRRLSSVSCLGPFIC